jgi:hypothetical protein
MTGRRGQLSYKDHGISYTSWLKVYATPHDIFLFIYFFYLFIFFLQFEYIKLLK